MPNLFLKWGFLGSIRLYDTFGDVASSGQFESHHKETSDKIILYGLTQVITDSSDNKGVTLTVYFKKLPNVYLKQMPPIFHSLLTMYLHGAICNLFISDSKDPLLLKVKK